MACTCVHAHFTYVFAHINVWLAFPGKTQHIDQLNRKGTHKRPKQKLHQSPVLWSNEIVAVLVTHRSVGERSQRQDTSKAAIYDWKVYSSAHTHDAALGLSAQPARCLLIREVSSLRLAWSPSPAAVCTVNKAREGLTILQASTVPDFREGRFQFKGTVT